MPQTGGVAPPRARRRRPGSEAFGLDVDWEPGSARAARTEARRPDRLSRTEARRPDRLSRTEATPRPGPAPRSAPAPQPRSEREEDLSEWRPTYDPSSGRRTVTIRGHGAERRLPERADVARHRAAGRRHERSGFRSDRTAMWAVLLGVVLILAAATSAHGAVLGRSARAARLPAIAAVTAGARPGAPMRRHL